MVNMRFEFYLRAASPRKVDVVVNFLTEASFEQLYRSGWNGLMKGHKKEDHGNI